VSKEKLEPDYRPLLRRHAEQLLQVTKTITDPTVRERIERLAMEIAAESEAAVSRPATE
jgi:hypothetical protein